ncbi:hypothetical protein [Pseudomonas petrae]|uniref:hypothetical protein n=1 Tax=Pseudomonas petrae TaxID=2912190 RepID=UPI001EF106A7|nr:hypothetical protein [Pseudomonas petrae]MCF7531363.1 hypothetical protein [Pseudomonas petrae]MCF7536921.1 hypothetical protein [Pseudomonas petrae]MCF7557701.1 hypothetical protein [Pseudomonas petrae]
MNSERDGAVDGNVGECSNPGFQFYTNTGHINYQSLQEGKLSFGWLKGESLVNHPRGKVSVEFQPDSGDSFVADPHEFAIEDTDTAISVLTEDIALELSKEKTTSLINKVTTFRAKVVEGSFKAYGVDRVILLINDQLPPLKCANIVPDKAEFDLDATTQTYLVFSQEAPGGRSGTVAPVIVAGNLTFSVTPVAFYENSGRSRGALNITMAKRYLRDLIGEEVFVGCRWSFGQGGEYKEYYSEMRKLKVTGTPA